MDIVLEDHEDDCQDAYRSSDQKTHQIGLLQGWNFLLGDHPNRADNLLDDVLLS